MRPLDLQVNINTVNSLSQTESGKLALAASMQREMQTKNLEDGIQGKESVMKSEEASDTKTLKKEDINQKETRVKERTRDQKRQQTQKDESSDEENRENENQDSSKKTWSPDYKVNYLA